jgi:hypothetical protein
LPALILAAFTSAAWSQTTERYQIKDAREILPKEFGFDLPDAPVEPYASANVTTTDEDNDVCVARVHARVGDNFIVMLPDGELVARQGHQVSPTEREFKPADGETIAARMAGDRLRGFQTKVTDHFVFVYNTTPEFAEVTFKVMETMLEGVTEYCREQGLNVHPPQVKLPVIMFHTEQQFASWKPIPPGVVAYYEILSNRVILHEQSSLQALSVELARQELLSNIAHECAHQILHNIGVQQRLSRWPMWLGEGIAEYLSPTKPGHRFAWKGAGKINDLRMWELEGFLQLQYIKGFNGDTLKGAVDAATLDSSGYAVAWTITHYLAQNRKADLDRYMRYLSRMPPLQGMLPPEGKEEEVVAGNMVHFKKFFGEDITALENEIITHMADQKYESPFGGLPHFVCTVEIPDIDGPVKHACFYPNPGGVQEWQAAVLESLPEAQRKDAQFELRQFPDRGAANSFIRKWKK